MSRERDPRLGIADPPEEERPSAPAAVNDESSPADSWDDAAWPFDPTVLLSLPSHLDPTGRPGEPPPR